MAFTSGLVNVHSTRHHEMLVNGLWNFFQTNHAVDFEIKWDGRSIQAHQLILDVFLSPRQSNMRMLDGRNPRPAPSLSVQQKKSSMDLIMEFLYNGKVDVPREKLQNLLDVAKELNFVIMIEAVEVAIVNDKAECLFGKDMCSSKPVVRSSYVSLQRISNSTIDSDEMDSAPPVPPKKPAAKSTGKEKVYNADVGSNDYEDLDIEGGDVDSEHRSKIHSQDGRSSGKSYSTSAASQDRNSNADEPSTTDQSEPSSSILAPPWPLLAYGVHNISPSRLSENHGETSSSEIHGHVYSQQPAFPYLWKPTMHDEPHEPERRELPPPPPMVKITRHPHGGDRPYRCETCFKGFKRSEHLRAHIMTHTRERPFKCDLCGKAYSQSGALFVHRRTHSGIKPYKCDICGKAFNQSGCLKVHMLQHTGERPFKCESCEKTFKRKQRLDDHMLTHTAKKKFKCEICGAEFSHHEWSDFNLHKLEHTGKTALVCDICGKSFAGRKNMNAHKRVHREAGKKFHQCEICGQAFRVKHSMKLHMRVHTGEKPYDCKICEKSFSCRRHLQVHIRSERHKQLAKVAK